MMRARVRYPLLAALLWSLSAPLFAGTCGGPVILAGHDADDHGFEDIYAGLFDVLHANTTNGGFGILSIGDDIGSDAYAWIDDVASRMTVPMPVIHVNDTAILTQGFTGYAILHVPSDEGDTNGGITQVENDFLATRAADIAAFVNGGGALFGLTQGSLTNPWSYVAVVAPVTQIDISYTDITATPEGLALGITDTNLDGCCFHNVFTSFPAFFDVLAIGVNDEASFIGGVRTCVLPFCGDGKLDPGEECDDGNNVDGDGCSAVCVKECVPVPVDLPPVIVCHDCEHCNAATRCDIDLSCTDIAVAIDPEGRPLTVTCDVPGPYPVGTTAVTVRADDGTTQIEKICAVTVKDCEPPVCLPPAPIELECNAHCGNRDLDPDIIAFLARAAALDNCPAVSVSAVAPPLFGAGCSAGLPTPVVFIATDAIGLERSCSSSITVRDTTTPIVTGCGFEPAPPRSPSSPMSPVSPASPASPKPPRSPMSPTSPTSTPTSCVGASSGLFKVRCGTASDACDKAPTISAKLTVTRYEVDPTGCVLVTEEIPVECNELIEIRRLAPPCPASPPSSPLPPRPPNPTNSAGLRLIEGERILLEVIATDSCGHVSAPCVVDAGDPMGPLPCTLPEPICKLPLCGPLPPVSLPVRTNRVPQQRVGMTRGTLFTAPAPTRD